MSKLSIPTWLKKNSTWAGPYEKIVTAVLHHAQHGDHPDIAFEGTALELATALYLEHVKKATPLGGLYCTRSDVAEKMARSLKLREGHVVLIPGLGLGALALAVQQVAPGARIIGVENQPWLVEIARATELPISYYDDFLVGPESLTIDAVIVNPPFGKIWGDGVQAERSFMARIAKLTLPSVKVAALLPAEPGYFFDKLKGKWAWLRSAFSIEAMEYLLQGGADPKSIPCTRYLLERV